MSSFSNVVEFTYFSSPLFSRWPPQVRIPIEDFYNAHLRFTFLDEAHTRRFVAVVVDVVDVIVSAMIRNFLGGDFRHVDRTSDRKEALVCQL